MTTFEICCGNINEVEEACKKGADRIELCSGMEFDGLTPSTDLIIDGLKLCSKYNVKLVVMLRCRGGDFVYSQNEIEEMLDTLKDWKDNDLIHLDGIVFGAISKDDPSSPDVNTLSKVVNCASPWPVTFHKAIDFIIPAKTDATFSTTAIRVINQLDKCGVRRILTSGLHRTADEGKDVIRDMVKYISKNSINITIIMAGGIRGYNVQRLIYYTKITEIHSKSCCVLDAK